MHDVCVPGPFPVSWPGAVCSQSIPEPICDAGRECGFCLTELSYPATDCPTLDELISYPTCADAPIGGMCEGDGECGTSDTLDNCQGYDVYRKVELPDPRLYQKPRLTHIKLPRNSLAGTLPRHLALASHLQEIDFGENQISGTIPSEWNMLTVMHTLVLTGNRLSGSVPPDLFSNGSAWRGARCGGHLGRSRTDCRPSGVYLSSNLLSGTIPPQLGSLRTTGKRFFCGDGSISAIRPSDDGVDYCKDVSKCPCGPCCYCSCDLPTKLNEVYLHRNQLCSMALCNLSITIGSTALR